MSEVAERLSRWIQEVDLEPGATRLDVISGAAKSLAKSTGEEEILNLVLLAHGRARGDAVASVAAALREHDEESAVREGDLLANLTATATVAFALESDSKVAVPFGLAVRSATFLGLEAAVSELDALARAGLARASESERRRSKLSVVGANLDAALQDWPEFPEGQQVITDNLNEARKAVEKASQAASGVTSRALPPITRRFEALEEEVDVLWWAFGEHSEIADKPFKSIPEQAAGCVAGLELAARTARRAPLPSARAILARVLQARVDKPTDLRRALPAAVKAVGDQWVDAHPSGHPLLPVLSSLEEFRSLDGKEVWRETVLARWQVDPDHETTVLDLAEQVNREALLARAPAE